MSQESAPPPPEGLGRIGIGDLLLILILTLGAARIIAWLLFSLAGPGLVQSGPVGLLLVTLSGLLLQSLIMLFAIYTVAIRWRGLRWSDLGLRPIERKWIVRGIAAGFVLVPVAALTNAGVAQVIGHPIRNPQVSVLAPAGFSWPAMLAMMAMAGVVAPIGEEIAFRGLFFAWLDRRLGLVWALLISGLCFALLHGALALMPALFLVGIALALVYHYSGSVWPAIVAHGVFNSIMIVILYTAMAQGLPMG